MLDVLFEKTRLDKHISLVRNVCYAHITQHNTPFIRVVIVTHPFRRCLVWPFCGGKEETSPTPPPSPGQWACWRVSRCSGCFCVWCGVWSRGVVCVRGRTWERGATHNEIWFCFMSHIPPWAGDGWIAMSHACNTPLLDNIPVWLSSSSLVA